MKEIIPTYKKNWKIVTLSQLCQKKGIQTGPFGSQLHQKDYVKKGTPIITVEHLGEARIIHKENIPQVSDEDKRRLSRFILEEGDIVLSRVGSVDVSNIVTKSEEGWLFSGRCLRIRVDKKKINPNFLSLYLRHPKVKRYLRVFSVGATMPSLNTKILMNLPVTYPEDQKVLNKTTELLISIDNKIQINQKMIENLESIMNTIFNSWFVNFDPTYKKIKGHKTELLDDINNLFPNEIVQSQMGAIPKGWKITNLGSAIIWNEGKTWKKEYRINHGSIKSFGANGHIGFSSEQTQSGRVIFVGKIGSCGSINYYNGPFFASNNVFFISLNKNKYLEYFRYLINSIDFSQYIGGSSNPYMPLKNFEAHKIIMPDESILDVFKKIAEIFRTKIEFIEKENDVLKDLSKKILPKLISGELKISDAENIIKERSI